MLIVTATLTFEGPLPDSFLEAVKTVGEITRQEAGCISYTIARDLVNPNILRFAEQWQDEAALRAHFGAEHMGTFRKAFAGAPKVTVETKFFDVNGEIEFDPRK